MTTPGDFKDQLIDLTTLLTNKVADRLIVWSKDLPPNDKKNVLRMVEDNLPTVITNAIAKSPSLHSAKGVQYLEEHLEDMADTWARKFVGRD
jgi:fumarate hydratase class II